MVNGHKSAAHTDSPDMAALVRRTLAEVCTVAVLLVNISITMTIVSRTSQSNERLHSDVFSGRWKMGKQ